MFLIILQNKIKENPECQYNSLLRFIFIFEFRLTFCKTEFHSAFVLEIEKMPKCPFGLSKLKSEYKNSTLLAWIFERLSILLVAEQLQILSWKLKM